MERNSLFPSYGQFGFTSMSLGMTAHNRFRIKEELRKELRQELLQELRRDFHELEERFQEKIFKDIENKVKHDDWEKVEEEAK